MQDADDARDPVAVLADQSCNEGSRRVVAKVAAREQRPAVRQQLDVTNDGLGGHFPGQVDPCLAVVAERRVELTAGQQPDYDGTGDGAIEASHEERAIVAGRQGRYRGHRVGHGHGGEPGIAAAVGQ